MKFNLRLKEPHIDVVENLKGKHLSSSNEDIIKMYVKAALNLHKNDLIFGKEREKCSGGCFGSEPQFEVDMDETDFNKLKKIYEDYDFDKYETDEEVVSKIIRCIINFIDDEPKLISIWIAY